MVTADEYVSALPVDVFKRMLPAKWSTMPFFRQTDELEGEPDASPGRRPQPHPLPHRSVADTVRAHSLLEAGRRLSGAHHYRHSCHQPPHVV